MRRFNIVAVGIAVVLWWTSAHAYIGPGVAAGTIAIVLGILTSIFFAFVGILWYPIKRVLRGWKKSARALNQRGRDSQDSGSR